MPYARQVPHVTEKGYMSQINDLVNPPLLADRTLRASIKNRFAFS
jgi:hypothetical protein